MASCELCHREAIAVTRHHLIPRSRHRKPRSARAFARTEMNSRIAMLCVACHKFIHTVLSEKQLAAGYNTLDSLLAHPEIYKFVQWVSNKPPGLRIPSARRRF